MGRWYSLFSRGVRKKELDYSDWRGTDTDYRRERLLLDGVEKDLIEVIIIAPTAKAKETGIKFLMPWLYQKQELNMEDIEEEYNRAMAAYNRMKNV